jgi:hypothetical protein
MQAFVNAWFSVSCIQINVAVDVFETYTCIQSVGRYLCISGCVARIAGLAHGQARWRVLAFVCVCVCVKHGETRELEES